MDRFTWWPEAIPLADTSAKSCTWVLLFHWVTYFGLPTDISSERGAQFTSQLWTVMIELLGTKFCCTMMYHLQANGLVEHFHRHLKATLEARLKDANWLDVLPWVLLGIHTAPKEDLHMSSAELIYGAPLTMPGDFIAVPHAPVSTVQHLQQLCDKVQSLTPVPTLAHRTPLAAFSTSLNNAQCYIFYLKNIKYIKNNYQQTDTKSKYLQFNIFCM